MLRPPYQMITVVLNGVVVSKAIDWKGPKGNIAKDQLLVGQISTQKVKVLPATYLLGEQTLSLVATDGSVAPVTVTATANTQDNAEHTGGRAIKRVIGYCL